MRVSFLQRLGIILAFLTAVAAVSTGVWRYGYLQALNQLSRQGEADLALASDRLMSQLERYRGLAVLMADHPQVAALAAGADPSQVKALFLEVSDKTGALDMLFVDLDGTLLAAADAAVGQYLGAAPFVRRAQQGALGWGHGMSTLLPVRAFYHAAPVFGDAGKVTGVVIVATDIAATENEWRGGFRPVFFTDAQGEVFMANRSELVGWRRSQGAQGLIPDTGAKRAFDSYRAGDHDIWRIDWGPYLPKTAMHLTQDLPVIGLVGEALVDVTPARRLALLQAAAVAGLCLAFGALLFLAAERREALRRINADLETRVHRRTRALSETNAALRREAEEREQAQVALARAQADLVQAGKLSALGQMSAGISHELNQPLMAIRSYAENAVQFQQRDMHAKVSENLGRISDMARRMGRIIQNLRAFSKQQAEPITRVELVQVLQDAAEMIAPRAQQMGADVRLDLPAAPLWVKGGEVRLGQVFVNLMTNALDAMNGCEARSLQVSVRVAGIIAVEVRDSGPGVEVPEKVFDPFYSTKEVGATEGMGLGLSISYGIAKSFGGDIRVRNCNPGALFIVELQPWEAQQAA